MTYTILFMLIAAGVNLLMNIFLIPHLGAIGAAISTLIAYTALILAAYIVNQRIYPIRFKIGIFVMKLLVGSVLYVGTNFLVRTQRPLIGWSLAICSFLLYSVFLLVYEGLSGKELKEIARYIGESFSKIRDKRYA